MTTRLTQALATKAMDSYQPGTQLYDMYVEEFGEDYWRNYILDENYDAYIPRPGCSMTEEEIQRLTQLAYVRFYYRPQFAMKTLMRMRSWHEFRRSASTAFRMERAMRRPVDMNRSLMSE